MYMGGAEDPEGRGGRGRDRGEGPSAPATSTSLWACGLGIPASHAAEDPSPPITAPLLTSVAPRPTAL
jgi:hypothetical protein